MEDTILFVRTPTVLYESMDESFIKGFVKKGEAVSVLEGKDGYSKYKVRYKDIEGYIRPKYLVQTKEEALSVYDFSKTYQYHLKMKGDLGGSAATLDYFPVEKKVFSENKMPEEIRAIYLNANALKKVDDYISFAKENHINAFVVDIKEEKLPSFKSDVMKKYSNTSYRHALYEKDVYKEFIDKLKDNGFYLIGRIVVFKDSFYIMDHPEDAIQNRKLHIPLKHNNSYWPSPYSRNVWQYNVELAKESINNFGFSEIQFDYVRFPDGTRTLEEREIIDYNNNYDESKAEAIQSFVMYASDEVHDLEAYVSVDVFGESAHNYVTSYGQYWPAISNVVDVISGMPYPDHFQEHQYGIKEVVWTVPYQLLKKWGEYVEEKQSIIPTPAIVRNWIQAYDTKKTPSVIYDATKVSSQIKALYEDHLTGGYMAWNASSSLSKYEQIKEAFRRNYQK